MRHPRRTHKKDQFTGKQQRAHATLVLHQKKARAMKRGESATWYVKRGIRINFLHTA